MTNLELATLLEELGGMEGVGVDDCGCGCEHCNAMYEYDCCPGCRATDGHSDACPVPRALEAAKGFREMQALLDETARVARAESPRSGPGGDPPDFEAGAP